MVLDHIVAAPSDADIGENYGFFAAGGYRCSTSRGGVPEPSRDVTALTYGTIGVLAGPRLGLLGGLYVMLALPFIDIGIAQNAMFDAAPPAWTSFMPAHGSVRVLLDGAFAPSLDESGALPLRSCGLGASRRSPPPSSTASPHRGTERDTGATCPGMPVHASPSARRL